MKKVLIGFMFLLFVLGCTPKVPEPESIKVEAAERKDIVIHHMVKGNNVLIECIPTGVSFSNEKMDMDKGKILLYVNGQLHHEYNTAAFIVKNLTAGTHKLKVELVKPNNEPFDMSKEFFVTIK